MCFDDMGYIGSDINGKDNNHRWPYVYYKRLNFYKQNIEFKDKNYPKSLELNLGKVNFNSLKVINNKLVENKLVVPQVWAVAEMFFIF